MAKRLQRSLLRSDLPPSQSTSRRVKQAAVLVPLILREQSLTAVFTRRHAELEHHPSEISFPGGATENDELPQETALREAQEEIGLEPTAVSIVGALTPRKTRVTGFLIYPFVGLIAPQQSWQISTAEVVEVLEFPLAQLAENRGRKWLMRHAIPWHTDAYRIGDVLIWGATARILRDLLTRLDSVMIVDRG